jgi:Na+-transporting methylmalonyl-CoA/oxaloacetate decarboxylase gamma subunit
VGAVVEAVEAGEAVGEVEALLQIVIAMMRLMSGLINRHHHHQEEERGALVVQQTG